MGRCLIKIPDGDRSWYLEWSSVVDAPVTYGMSLEELHEYIKDEYGREGLHDLPERLMRVEKYGASALPVRWVAEVIACNRAGEGETKLTLTQIRDYYCRNRPAEDEPHRPKPRGTTYALANDEQPT